MPGGSGIQSRRRKIGGGKQPIGQPSPTFDWRFAANRSLTDVVGSKVFTFTRASIGTHFNSAGVLVEAAVDVPRWDYDPYSLQSVGLLHEPAATNLCLWCRDLTNAAWTKTNAVVAKDVTGLDGVASSASRFTATAANAEVSQVVTAASARYIASVWLKRITGTGTVSIGLSNSITLDEIELTGTGWVRFDIDGTLTNPAVIVKLATSGDVVAVDCAQIETWPTAGGVPNPTSPIITTTTAVTRQRDIVTVTTATLGAGFNAAEGAFVVECTPCGIVGSTNNFFFNVSDGSTSERYAAFVSTGGAQRHQIADGGVDQAVHSFPEALVVGHPIFAGLAYKANDVLFMNNLGEKLLSATATMPTVTSIELGRRNTGSYLYGHIHRFRYYSPKLSLAQMGLVRATSGLPEAEPPPPPPPPPPPDPDPGLTRKAQFVPPNPPGYTLDLCKQDLFNTGVLDTTTWGYSPEGARYKNPGGAGKPTVEVLSNPGSQIKYGFWANDAVSFTTALDNDGVTSIPCLKIRVYRLAPGASHPGSTIVSSVESFVTSGIESEGLYEQQYGYFTCKAKFPPFYGWWLSFWVMTRAASLSAGVPGPQDGVEYDVFETARQLNPAVPATTRYNRAWHYDGYGSTHPKSGAQVILGNRDKWHEWGFLWTPTKCTWYVDGIETFSTTTAISHVPQHVILGAEIGNWGDYKDGDFYRDLHHARANTGQSDSDLDRGLFAWIEWYALTPE